ncbi:3-dehydroquinate synthase [Evtepia gabavorous]|uniref:3-dehydroquinate synthase n=1 Tax=Evtepia gabavorous TaxID=2211183 RepID=UPI001D351D8F|nr:3-dehydroquinate synthase [Bacillota bacterium]
MTTVTVRASRPYEVTIGRGLLDTVGRQAAGQWKGRSAAVVSDSTVAPLYLNRVKDSLERAGFQVHSFVFPAGEDQKNGGTYLKLLEFLAARRLTRADGLIALGGGVVGDLAGFAAATFLRGIGFLQLPTTLLAAVDSSVGGKTAIDLTNGKNLAGAFYQPQAVLCDLDTLDTLPAEVFADGCAEVIKYGMIGDPALLARLETVDFRADPEELVARCVAQKRDLVEQDEFDTGARQLLNLGHTLGHGVEACSGYTVSHGRAVAIGMTLVTRAAVAFGRCPAEVLPRLRRLLERYGLPDATAYSAQALYEKTLSDKKRSGDTISLVVPIAWGASQLVQIPVSELPAWIERGLGL